MSIFSIGAAERAELPFGVVRTSAERGRIELATRHGLADAHVATTTGEFCVWSCDTWCCVIPLDGASVLVGSEDGWLRHVGDLARLDLSGRYDPGGMHRVRFDPVGRDKVVISTEFGLALVESVGHLVWSIEHGDPTCFVEAVADGRVTMSCEAGTRALYVANGEESAIAP
jgi:hypothetical protein